MKKIISIILAAIMLMSMFSVAAYAEETLTLDMKAVEGASIRIGDVAGIRFQTLINKAELDALVAENGEANVEIGTLIAPTVYVQKAGAFTMAALDAYKEAKPLNSAAYVKVKATYSMPFSTKTVDGVEYYVYAGSLENIREENVMLDFSGIGYVKVGDEVVYASYNEADSSRTVGYVAYRAYLANDANLGENGKTLIDGFANKFLAAKLGEGTPDMSTILYFESYDDMSDTADYEYITSMLGWKDNFFNCGGAYYVYGKDVKAKYDDGKLVFDMKFGARENHTEDEEFTTNNTLGKTKQNNQHGLFTIPGLDNTTLFADGNDTFVLQFDMKIVEGNGGVGFAYCEKDKVAEDGTVTFNNFGRGRFVDAGNSWVVCFESGGTDSWYKKPGSIASYCAPAEDVVRVQFVFNKDMTYQRLILNGQELNVVIANANQVSGEFDIGLYFVSEGITEIDNLLVYSYNSAANQ